MRLRNALLLFGPIFGYAVGVTFAIVARASEEWNVNAKHIFKRRRRITPPPTPIEDIMKRPKYAAFVRDLNRREPK